MDKKWVHDNLKGYINDDNEIVLPSGNLVAISSFLEMFGGIETSYEDLIEADDLGVDDHGIHRKRGYKPFFDELKQKGILN